jgi:hypothetical protein
MDNVTVESLEKQFKGEGERRYREIESLGGFGESGNSMPNPGGLDVRGVVDERNTAVSTSAKAKIAELAGMKSDDRARIDSGATTSSADKMKSK